MSEGVLSILFHLCVKNPHPPMSDQGGLAFTTAKKEFNPFMTPAEMYSVGRLKEAVDLMNHYLRLFPPHTSLCAPLIIHTFVHWCTQQAPRAPSW